jgi:hypothetical protein
VHTKDSCVINFYDQVNGETTEFWEGDVKPIDVANDNGNLYMTVDTANLTLAEQFTAKPGDVWLLNTRQPHSINPINNADTRIMLQIFLGIPFDEVLKHVHTSTSNYSTPSSY